MEHVSYADTRGKESGGLVSGGSPSFLINLSRWGYSLTPGWLRGPVFPVFGGGEALEGFELAGEVELVHDGLGHLLHDTCSERLKAEG
jgi:hypothetical protein